MVYVDLNESIWSKDNLYERRWVRKTICTGGDEYERHFERGIFVLSTF